MANFWHDYCIGIILVSSFVIVGAIGAAWEKWREKK